MKVVLSTVGEIVESQDYFFLAMKKSCRIVDTFWCKYINLLCCECAHLNVLASQVGTTHHLPWLRCKPGPGCACPAGSLPSEECLLHTKCSQCCQPCRVASQITQLCLKVIKYRALRNILTLRPIERDVLIQDQQTRFKTALKFYWNIPILEYIK